MADEPIKMSSVIKLYLRLRGEKERIQNEAKSKIAAIDEKLVKLDGWFLNRMKDDDVTSYKSDEGTVYKTEVDYANVANWDALIEHVRNSGDYTLLEKRVSKTAVRAYLDDKRPVPPGVNYGKRIDIVFRKPSD